MLRPHRTPVIREDRHREIDDDSGRKLRREFAMWQIVTSPWAFHRAGFKKVNEFLTRHRAEFAALNTEMENFWQSVEQPDWEYRCKIRFKNQLERVLADFLKRPLKLIVTGSTVSGVGTANSDADICMCAPGILYPLSSDYRDGTVMMLGKAEERRRKGVILRRCKQELAKWPDLGIEKMEFVDAQIPLLKMAGVMVDEETGNEFIIDADLSISNEVFVSGLHNSHLIKGYTRVDKRFAPLVTVIKKWSWFFGVRDPQKRRFNSYAMTLLVIHFLQCALPRPVLPNLQGLYPGFYALAPTAYPSVVDMGADFPDPLPEPAGLPNCGLNVAELFYAFLAYYSTIDLHSSVIRVKCGRISERGDRRDNIVHESNDDVCIPPEYARFSEVFIEDPIDEHNPGRTVDDWPLIKTLFSQALHLFDRMDNPADRAKYPFPDLEDLTGYGR